MPDSFFATNKPRKRKRNASGNESKPNKFHRKNAPTGRTGTKVNGAQKKNKKLDEELGSDDTGDEGGIDDLELRAASEAEGSGEEDEDETPAEKRLRLAKLYVQSVKESLADGEYDAAEIDRELISTRLKQDVMEHSGRVHLFVADTFDFSQPVLATLRTRGHQLSVTSAVASEDAKYLFTAGKEGSINKWDLSSGKKLATFFKVRAEKGKGKEKADVNGHTSEVLALAISSDGKFLASGGKDRRVGIWDVEKGVWVKGFVGHKDTISALTFRKGTQQLYSGSFDRTLKLFDLSVMGYVETLFGHQDNILDLDALRGETAVTVGARDKTVRFWKIVDESQLVFRGGGKSAIRELLDGGGLEGLGEDDEAMDVDERGKGKRERRDKPRKFVEGSLECVAMIDETTFVSGGDSGSICLWNTQKKKPIFTQALAHGLHQEQSETEGIIETPRWITAITSLRYSDLIASGSWEGDIRIWKLDSKLKSFSLVGTISAIGVINSLQFVSPPKSASFSWIKSTNGAPADKLSTTFLVAGIGQEHKFGRWLKIPGSDGAVNRTAVIALRQRTLAP